VPDGSFVQTITGLRALCAYLTWEAGISRQSSSSSLRRVYEIEILQGRSSTV
jgi:hypothetical protein